LNRVGMNVDGTHTSYRTTMDMMEFSKNPVVFSTRMPARYGTTPGIFAMIRSKRARRRVALLAVVHLLVTMRLQRMRWQVISITSLNWSVATISDLGSTIYLALASQHQATQCCGIQRILILKDTGGHQAAVRLDPHGKT
jgi:hypothetical protein